MGRLKIIFERWGGLESTRGVLNQKARDHVRSYHSGRLFFLACMDNSHWITTRGVQIVTW